jgi:hypothetical protein
VDSCLRHLCRGCPIPAVLGKGGHDAGDATLGLFYINSVAHGAVVPFVDRTKDGAPIVFLTSAKIKA